MPVWESRAPLAVHINSQILNGGWKSCFSKITLSKTYLRDAYEADKRCSEQASVLAVLESRINRSLILCLLLVHH